MDDLYLRAHPEPVIVPCMCVPDHIDSGWLLGRSKPNVVAERRQDAKADQPVITVTESTGMVLVRIAKPSDSHLPTACSLPQSPRRPAGCGRLFLIMSVTGAQSRRLDERRRGAPAGRMLIMKCNLLGCGLVAGPLFIAASMTQVFTCKGFDLCSSPD
jgi:hypothetical protein